MQEELKTKKNSSPWLSLLVYIIVSNISLFIKFHVLDSTQAIELGSTISHKVISITILTLLTVFPEATVRLIALAVQYAIIKYLTQKISKEQNVYQYEIWNALIYSGIILLVWNLFATYLNLQDNLILRFLNFLIPVCFFFLFYLSGQEKKEHVKKITLIVQPVCVFLTLPGALNGLGLIITLTMLIYISYSAIKSFRY